MAERLSAIDHRDLRYRRTRRGGATSAQVAQALAQYSGQATDDYGRYAASIDGQDVSSMIVTRPE